MAETEEGGPVVVSSTSSISPLTGKPARKPVVLIFVRHYLPGSKAGGPIRSIANLVERLGDEFDFRVVTLDRDLGDTEAYSQIMTERWVSVGKAQVMYLPIEAASIKRFRELLCATGQDIVYLNSIFDVRFALLPALAARSIGRRKVPVIIAPRGEFSPGAIALKSWKKKPYLWVIRRLALFKQALWQASTDHEAGDIRREVGEKTNIRVATNLSNLSVRSKPLCGRTDKDDSVLRVVFLSRISPKKNLDFAIRVLSKVRSRVEFRVVGPASDVEYFERCVELAKTLPDNITIEWVGSVSNDKVPGIMALNDLLFFPTRGENFGHVIVEALSVGTPVLLSDTTPWRGLKERGVGWDLPLSDTEAFVEAIEFAARQSQSERSTWRTRVFDFAEEKLTAPDSVQANRRLFNDYIADSMVGGGQKRF